MSTACGAGAVGAENTWTKFSSVGVKSNFGGTASASLWVLNAVRMIHSTGKK